MLLVTLVAGCDDLQCVCTLQFASIQLSVLNPAAEPEPGVEIRTTIVRTGEVVHPLPNDGQPVGVYTILDDTAVGLLRVQGEQLQVTGAKGNLSFTAQFVVRPDGSCRCHIVKVSGPEVVTLQ